jgi:predicted metal-dependent HD superfamily phosphohydrolase
MILKATFEQLIGKYNDYQLITNELWIEIEKYYQAKKRYYHTLSHLENLLNQLLEVKERIQNWDSILFTLYYHDVIYDALKSDNEEQSALLAEKRMLQIGVPTESIALTKAQILATKTHIKSENLDTNYFTDADLSILGQDWDAYHQYLKSVRKEYAIYPKLVYNPGRKKVLNHFLGMERIFKTDYFFDKYENQAKLNLKKELDLL